jgi:phosphoglycolate phosphatase
MTTLPYRREHLVILDADGTTIDAFGAINKTFAHHGMSLGDLERFQKRRHVFKYLGGLKEFPTNLQRQVGAKKRRQLIDTLTQIYRDEAALYPSIVPLIQRLIESPTTRVGLVTRNITREPVETLTRLFARHDIDIPKLDYLVHIPLKEDKTAHFRTLRQRFEINPARTYACGDEKKDFVAAVQTGAHPFMVSYGFEDLQRLTARIGVPEDLISRTPEELCARVLHALDLDPATVPQAGAHRSA